MSKWLNVGKITKPHGLRGEVKVYATTDFPDERFAPGNTLYLDEGKDKPKKPLVVETRRTHKQFELIRFEGYGTINDVEALNGAILKIPIEDLDLLDEGEFYYHEIIGCRVVTDDGKTIGTIKEILETGANDVWVVKRQFGKDALIPYIEDVVKKVDVENKQVTIHLLEGLIDED
ncbi:MAG TPA: ribosome maturation factor RimM [Bacillales bacterium]|nr:ribosome maturation factor RimM [Bacillales bacterium]